MIAQIILLIYFVNIVILAFAVYNSISTIKIIQESVFSTKPKTFEKTLAELFYRKETMVIVVGGIAISILAMRFVVTGEVGRLMISGILTLFSLSFLRFSVLNKNIWTSKRNRDKMK